MVSRVSSLGLSPRRARGPTCAWSSRASGRISSRPTRAPSTDGRSSLQSWSRSWRGQVDVEVNTMAGKTSKASAKAAKKAAAKRVGAKPARLAGGNHQIAKADGDAPVRAYIAAMPDWKRDVGRQLDALIVRTVPGVRKAVKWNSPFYGIEGQGWFLSFHCFTRYVKVAFFRGASLRPLPPGESKHKD